MEKEILATIVIVPKPKKEIRKSRATVAYAGSGIYVIEFKDTLKLKTTIESLYHEYTHIVLDLFEGRLNGGKPFSDRREQIIAYAVDRAVAKVFEDVLGEEIWRKKEE